MYLWTPIWPSKVFSMFVNVLSFECYVILQTFECRCRASIANVDLRGQYKYRLRTADCGLRTVDCGLRTADRGPRTADRGPRTADRGPRTVDCGLRSVDC